VLNTGESILNPHAIPVLLAAFAQIQVWLGDPFNSTTTVPTDIDQSSTLKSLKRVREIHTGVMLRVSKYYTQTGKMFDGDMYLAQNASIDLPFWNAMMEDLKDSNIPAFQRLPPPSFTNPSNGTIRVFNQQSLSLVLFSIAFYPVLMPTTFGISACDQELYSYLHLWAGLGYALGIDNEFNPALQSDLPSARQLAADIFNGYIIPSLFNMDNGTFVFLEGNINAANAVFPIYTKGVAMTFLLQNMVGIPAPKLWAQLSVADKALYYSFVGALVPELMNDPVFRTSLNTVVNAGLTGTGTETFGSDFLTYAGRANTCYHSNLNSTDYDNVNTFDQEYPNYEIAG